MTVTSDEIQVSVVVVTYNHERFIADALETVLAQHTTFDFEVIVSEDCSADRTRQILFEYSRRHPRRLRLLLSETNLNSNLVTSRALSMAQGNYVAFLDGDDYWTSPVKLQTQADFLDAHPECVMCYHNAHVIDDGGSVAPSLLLDDGHPTRSDLDQILQENRVPGSSPMIRRRALQAIPEWYDAAPLGDWPLYAIAAHEGLIGYIDEPMSVYRKHNQGYWRDMLAAEQQQVMIAMYEILENYVRPENKESVRRGLARSRRALDWLSIDLGTDDVTGSYEVGHWWADGWCTPILVLRLRTKASLCAVAVTIWNPDARGDRPYNTIRARVADREIIQYRVAAGQEIELVFPAAIPKGTDFEFRLESEVEVTAQDDQRSLGVVIRSLKFATEARLTDDETSRRGSQVRHVKPSVD